MKRRETMLLLASVLLVGILVAFPFQRQNSSQFEPIRSLIRTELDQRNVVSISVAVAKEGKILWEEGFGWADKERRVPATEHTMYSLASISKPITATGIMVLKERGKIDIDKPINDYLGEAKVRTRIGNVNDATVRRVANHTSGLQLHYQFFYADEPHKPPTMDETIRRYGIIMAPPGERYQYANQGYGLLGYIIERVSGKSQVDFLREEVFLPLGMMHTSVHLAPDLERHQAIRYAADGTPLPFYDFDHPGASAVYSSAHDVVRFGMFHLKARLSDQKAILKDETIDEMQRPTSIMGPETGYGFGWVVRDHPGGYRLVSHSGGMPGVRTLLTLIPAEKIAIVVLTNSTHANPGMIVDEIIPIARGKNRQPPRDPPPAPVETMMQTPTHFLGVWTGILKTYKEEIPLTLQFKEHGEVQIQLANQATDVLNNARFSDSTVTGRTMGEIGTEESQRGPYNVEFWLRLRGDALNGVASAVSVHGNRIAGATSHWVEVRKKTEKAAGSK